MDRELANLIDVVAKLGPTGAILLFGVVITWRALPTLLKWWAAQIRQATIVAQAVPDMNAALQSMAQSGESSHELMKQMNKKLDTLLARS